MTVAPSDPNGTENFLSPCDAVAQHIAHARVCVCVCARVNNGVHTSTASSCMSVTYTTLCSLYLIMIINDCYWLIYFLHYTYN
jgi:hypothetical protein